MFEIACMQVLDYCVDKHTIENLLFIETLFSILIQNSKVYKLNTITSTHNLEKLVPYFQNSIFPLLSQNKYIQTIFEIFMFTFTLKFT